MSHADLFDIMDELEGFVVKVICHMTTSLDGKVTGDFFDDPVSYEACNHYYRIHREFEADAFACGRITMETSFTEERKIDVSEFDEVNNLDDFIYDSNVSFYAVSFDRMARVGWLESRIQDEDSGYDKSHIIEVVSESADKKMLAYYQSIGVSYIVVSSLQEALSKLESYFGIHTLLLEGGSVLNGSFSDEDLIDELSIVVSPVHGGDLPLFGGKTIQKFDTLSTIHYEHSIFWTKYIRNKAVNS